MVLSRVMRGFVDCEAYDPGMQSMLGHGNALACCCVVFVDLERVGAARVSWTARQRGLREDEVSGGWREEGARDGMSYRGWFVGRDDVGHLGHEAKEVVTKMMMMMIKTRDPQRRGSCPAIRNERNRYVLYCSEKLSYS
jgi:hypothetical protein